MRETRAFDLGQLFTSYATRHPDLRFWFSAPMDVAPELGTSATLRQMADLVVKTASRLQQAGVGRGDVVAIVKRPSPDVPVLQQAVVRLGAVPAMLWPSAPRTVLDELITRLRRPWLVTDPSVLTANLPGLSLQRLSKGVVTLAEGSVRVDQHSDATTDVTLPDGTVLITHSSGTTGVPKLMAFDTHGIAAHTRIQTRVAALLGLRGPGCFCLSYFHNRMPSALAAALERRGDLLLLDTADPTTAARLMGAVKPQVVETFPNVYLSWEQIAHHPAAPFSDVRLFINTFDAAHPRSVQTMLNASSRTFPLYLQAYGATEAGPLTIRLHDRHTAARADLRCVGHPIPGLTRNRIVPRPGTADASRRQGEIVIRAEGAALAYVGESAKQAPGSPRSWWPTGDLGRRGRFGCLHLLDRVVDAGDDAQSNLEREDVLIERFRQAREIVLVPAGHGTGTVPVVCTYDDEPLDRDAWRTATADMPELLAPVHLPWARLPLSSTWKVRRLQLREELTARTGHPLDERTSHT